MAPDPLASVCRQVEPAWAARAVGDRVVEIEPGKYSAVIRARDATVSLLRYGVRWIKANEVAAAAIHRIAELEDRLAQLEAGGG